MDKLTTQLATALRALFDCDALEMYRRDDNPEWDAPEVARARKALQAYNEARRTVRPRVFPPVPKDFPVRVLRAGQAAACRATCGVCGRSWDDAIATSYTPAPSARCPFEAFH